MNLFTDNTIEKGVMAIVRSKIADAQKEFNNEKKRLATDAKQAHKDIDAKLITDTNKIADSFIKQIVGKIL